MAKLLKRTLGLAAAGGAAYLAAGEFLFSQVLSRAAASRGFAGMKTEDILAGGPLNPVEPNWFETFLGKLMDDASGLGDFYNKSYFPSFQAGVKWFVEKNPEKVVTVSPRGARIHADLIANEKPSDVWIICIHGYSDCPRDFGGAAKVYHEWGYNTLFPHLCGHGDSEDNFISMGWLDRLDIVAWIDYLNRAYNNPQIILHGVSMGGATVMMTTGEDLPDNVVCAIEDCGYSSVWEEFEEQAKETLRLGSITPVGLSALDTVVRRRAGFSIKEASAVEQLKKSKTPTLFIHGDADRFVPFRMLQVVYDACAAEKELLVASGAEHAEACYQLELYYGTIRKFIDRYLETKMAEVSA